jgi:nucleotide-binding universal stress UspA family protein
MSHILVAVSTPWAAQHMVRPLAQLARRLKSSVTLLHVERQGGGGHPVRPDQSRQAINELHARLEEAGVRCEARFLEGVSDIPGAILQAARDCQATMIFMGITGKSPFARSASGDVPAELLRRTTVPVLLLPPGLDVEI